MIGEKSCLDVWIEEIEENKLCPSGISKLEGVRELCPAVRRDAHGKVDNSDGYKGHMCCC
jgi:hypothetical protein